MPLPNVLTLVTGELPYALRQDVEGYVRSLEPVWRNIYADVEANPEQVHPDEFFFFAGIWRIWGHVAGQRWIIQNSLDAAADYGATGISAGGYSYSARSPDVKEIRNLYANYRRWLNQRGFDFVTEVSTPRDLLWALRERHAS